MGNVYRQCHYSACDAEFRVSRDRRKFCSKSCANSHNNSGVRRNGQLPPICALPACSERTKLRNRKYCSERCMGLSKKVDWEEWLDGGDCWRATSVLGGLTTKAREAYWSRFERKCALCGWGESNPVLGYPLTEIDHIDGDRFNNHIDNLRPLCPNCHSLTPTYRSLNKKRNHGMGSSAVERHPHTQVAQSARAAHC